MGDEREMFGCSVARQKDLSTTISVRPGETNEGESFQLNK
jgi:hypothetical protein